MKKVLIFGAGALLATLVVGNIIKRKIDSKEDVEYINEDFDMTTNWERLGFKVDKDFNSPENKRKRTEYRDAMIKSMKNMTKSW